MSEELEGLLRKCHRSELLPLAESLGVNTELGLKQLASITARSLRRQGGHGFANAFTRRGEGPPYAEVLQGLAERMQVPVTGDVADVELQLMEAWVKQAWTELSEEQRADIWSQLEGEPPMPASAEEALVVARDKLGKRFAYAVGLTVARVALIWVFPLAPLTGCLALFLLSRPRDDRVLPAVLEVSRLRRMVLHRVTVGVVGSPSTGKDAAISAIFGVPTGNVNPIAGSTKEVEIRRLPGATALYVVNTPGMGDVVESVTEEARQVLDHIDVYVYLVNAQGGVQARELADYSACVKTGRPVLVVVNKIDTLREADRQRFLDDARTKLGEPEDFLAAAFDPLPQLSESPIGLEPVRSWLRKTLIGLGKDPEELDFG